MKNVFQPDIICTMVACRLHRAKDDPGFPDLMDPAGCRHCFIMVQLCHVFRHFKNAHPFWIIDCFCRIASAVCTSADLPVAVQYSLSDVDPGAVVEIVPYKHRILTGRIV